MKRILIAAAALALASCSLINRTSNPYEKDPFYARYLIEGNADDMRIAQLIDELRADPGAAPLHNELGSLLAQKGFPKDAEREFERAVNSDSDFYPAWYNLGQVRASRGDHSGARRALFRTIALKSGHAQALFELGLMAEKAGDSDEAIAYYAKAFRHNHELLDVRVNPKILDSKLEHLALLRLYPDEHERQAMSFQATPAGYARPEPQRQEAPSPEAPAQDIIPPAAPVTDPGTQPPPPRQ